MKRTILLLLASFAACVGTARDSGSDLDPVDGVDAVLRAYERAYNAHDAKALAAVHAEDGAYFVPSGEPIRGRQALERFWARSAGTGLVLVSEAHAVEDHVAWVAGRWTTGDGGVGNHGRFMLGLWRNAAGAFEIVVDLNNESRR